MFGVDLVRETTFSSRHDRFPVPLPCPNCGRTMQLTRSTADTGGISQIRSFGCGECGIWTSEDAMSRPSSGWSSQAA